MSASHCCAARTVAGEMLVVVLSAVVVAEAEDDGLWLGPEDGPPLVPGACRVRGGLPCASWRTASITAGSSTQLSGWDWAAAPRATARWRVPVRRLLSQASVSSMVPSVARVTPLRTGATRAMSSMAPVAWSEDGMRGRKVRSRPAALPV